MNKRLDTILSFIKLEDRVIDIGTDHAYIPIKLAKMGCKNIIASDVNDNVLKISKNNILNEHVEDKITLIKSNGLLEIDTRDFDTVIIAGMGYMTIKSILSNTDKLINISKIIIQSNNEIYKMRKYMYDIGYHLDDEKTLCIKNHFYVLMEFVKGNEVLTDEMMYLGIVKDDKKDYYQSLKNYYEDIKCKAIDDERIKFINKYLNIIEKVI